MFSICIPTLNNFNYLKICFESLKKNSALDNETIIHVNEGGDESLQYVKNNNYSHTSSKEKLWVCFSVNLAAKKTTKDFIVYAHDDMYFLQKWVLFLKNEILKLKNLSAE